MKKRSSIALLTALLAIVFAAGIGVYSNYIGMQIYQESSNHLLESYVQISKTFTLFVQRNWVVLSQWDSLMKNVQEDADIDSIWLDAQNNKLLWHYSDFYLFNESTQYLTVDGRKGSADSINGVFQEMYSKGEYVAENKETAQRYYKAALSGFLELESKDQADDNLYYKLGAMYKNGLGTEIDIPKAIEYFEKSIA